MKPIAFDGTLYKVTTLIDGGLRVSFDAPQSEMESVAALMKLVSENVKVVVMNAEAMANYYTREQE